MSSCKNKRGKLLTNQTTVIVDITIRMTTLVRAAEQSFKRFDCYEEISFDIVSANANTISTRWVISKKMNDDGSWRSKAMLVARGYEYKEKDRVSSDSPVASSAAQRLVLALLAEKQFIPNSWDFTTAFLQGESLTRDVFVVPSIDFVGSHVVWRLKKTIYGIMPAPCSIG
jgi:Reverse transcriptase (RNA-dependent DNA polymerase)